MDLNSAIQPVRSFYVNLNPPAVILECIRDYLEKLLNTAVVTDSDLTAKGTVCSPIYNPVLSKFFVMVII